MFVESNRHAMNRAKIFFEENLNTVKAQLPEVGLADMGLFGWTDFDGPASDSKQGVVTRGTLDNSSHSLSSISNISAEDASQPRCLKRGTKLREKEVSEKKITALEDELANLRAQIAMIVSLQEKSKFLPFKLLAEAAPLLYFMQYTSEYKAIASTPNIGSLN